MSKGADACHVIYSCFAAQATPIGMVVGEIYRTEHMIAINPLLNTLELRMVKPRDKNHKHIKELSRKQNNYVTVGVDTRFDIGSLMGFSGWQCFHLTMKSIIILYVKVKVISTAIERVVEKAAHLVIKGDVRIMADESVAQIYVLRGELFCSGKVVGLNRERNFALNLAEAYKLPPPVFASQGHSFGSMSHWVSCAAVAAAAAPPGEAFAPLERRPSLVAITKHLYYVGIVRKVDDARIVTSTNALISGFVQRAPNEPYRFSKGAPEFLIKFVGTKPPAEASKSIDDNANLLSVFLQRKAAMSLHALAGNGIAVFDQNASIKICGHLLVVDERDGSLIHKLSGHHCIKISSGNVKLYVCDDDIILLHTSNVKYNIHSCIFH